MKKAFTLMEMLLVIAAIAVLASVIFVAINPGERLSESNEKLALAHINQIRDAITQLTLDGYDIEDYIPNVHVIPSNQVITSNSCFGSYTHICAGDGEGDDDESCIYSDGTPPTGAPEDLDESEDFGFLVNMGYLSTVPKYAPLTASWGDSTGYMIATDGNGKYKLCVHESIDINGPIVRYIE